MGGGNLLQGFFDQTDATGFSVIFHVPPLLLADGRPAMILDFGDGSATWAADATGQVKHVYASRRAGAPWIVAPV